MNNNITDFKLSQAYRNMIFSILDNPHGQTQPRQNCQYDPEQQNGGFETNYKLI